MKGFGYRKRRKMPDAAQTPYPAYNVLPRRPDKRSAIRPSRLLILDQQRFQQVQIVQQLLQRFIADFPRRAQMIKLRAL